MRYGDPNRPTRAALPRPDEPRDLGPAATGNIARDGYSLVARRPRVDGYPDYVTPERASEIESIVRGYDGVMDTYDD